MIEPHGSLVHAEKPPTVDEPFFAYCVWRLISNPFPGLAPIRPPRLRQTADPTNQREFREFQRQCPSQRSPVLLDHQQYYDLLEQLLLTAWRLNGDILVFMERRDAALDAQFPQTFFRPLVFMGLLVTDAFKAAVRAGRKPVLLVQDTILRDIEPGSNRLALSGYGLTLEALRAIVEQSDLPNPGCLAPVFGGHSRVP